MAKMKIVQFLKGDDWEVFLTATGEVWQRNWHFNKGTFGSGDWEAWYKRNLENEVAPNG